MYTSVIGAQPTRQVATSVAATFDRLYSMAIGSTISWDILTTTPKPLYLPLLHFYVKEILVWTIAAVKGTDSNRFTDLRKSVKLGFSAFSLTFLKML